jgi:hypothetical protein
MTKLADLIRLAMRVSSSPMGFVPSTAKPPATMLLLAFASERWKQAVADAVAAGADAVVLANKPGDKEIAEAVGAAGEHPCGLLVADTGTDQIDRLRSLGVDFFVLEPEGPASALLEEKATLLLHLRQELNDVQLRALDALPVIALYVEREPGPITIWRHMELQRISGLSRKPLALRLQPDARQQDLLALRSAGVVLVTVDMKERDATGAVRGLRGIIDALPRRKSGRPDNLPRVSMPGAAAASAAEEEEDESDDDE